MRARCVPLLSTFAVLAACQVRSVDATNDAAAPRVRVWGTMREVLREGHTEGRVMPVDVATPDTIGVGALAGLAGEITIVDGRVLVAQANDQGCDVRAAAPDDRAALLVIADVPRWREIALPACADLDALEAAIARELDRAGIDRAAPTPVRVRGRAAQVAFHVIHGACPIAHPEGPAPWRFAGPAERVELVGVFAEGAGGRLTHHDRASHMHAVAAGRMGHLEDVALEGAVLLLPGGAPQAR